MKPFDKNKKAADVIKYSFRYSLIIYTKTIIGSSYLLKY